MEATQVPINRQLDNEDVVYTYNAILLFAATWMDLENIMPSEISQREKNKYCMIPLICGI